MTVSNPQAKMEISFFDETNQTHQIPWKWFRKVSDNSKATYMLSNPPKS
jgi:hypothetical protein